MAAPTSSEFALFQKLANPQKTDFAKPTAFRAAVQQQLHQPFAGPVGQAPDARSTHSDRSSRSSRSSHSTRSSRSSRSTTSRRSDHGGDVGSGTGARPDDMPFFGNFAPPPVSPAIDAQLHAEIEREKQGYLLELMKFKEEGIELTREYTMDDALVDIQFEYDRIKTHLETKTNVAFVSDMLMFGFQGIEMANQKWGPILELNGWAASVQEDKAKYNRVVERLYKKHWRYGSMSPEAEFGWLVGSSMVKHHLKNKWGLRTDGGSGGGGGGGFGSMFNTLGGLMPMMPGAGGMKPPPPPQTYAPPPTQGNATGPSGRPVMTRPNVRHFATPPPYPSAPAAPAPPPPPPPAPVAVPAADTESQELKDAKAALIKLEQQKESERELRNELKMAREQMNQMQQQMMQRSMQARNEMAHQQVTHQQQLERMQQQFTQQMMSLQRTQQQHQQAAAVQPEVAPVKTIPPLPDSSDDERSAVSSSSDDESDREISILGKPNLLAQVPRRATKIPPSALKLDL